PIDRHAPTEVAELVPALAAASRHLIAAPVELRPAFAEPQQRRRSRREGKRARLRIVLELLDRRALRVYDLKRKRVRCDLERDATRLHRLRRSDSDRRAPRFLDQRAVILRFATDRQPKRVWADRRDLHR